MSTSARFGMVRPDGSIISVYHHWDGYPDWLGAKLKENYSDEAKLSQLISGGDMSSLETEQTWGSVTREPQPLYYSERGEKTPPQISPSFENFMKLTANCGGEYAYLWDKGWKCYQPYAKAAEVEL